MSRLSGWNDLLVMQDGRVGEHAANGQINASVLAQQDSQRLLGGISSGVAKQGVVSVAAEVGVGD
jgi:hypothetical protein